MSKIALKPNDSGTATFTLAAPDSNTNRTLTLPDEEGTVATIENIPPGYEDQDALDLFNATGSAPVYACRAWVNFDGTGTVSIRDSGNVSSITDNGSGDYTVNFTTAMEDANYCFNLTASVNTGNGIPRILEHLEPNTKTNTAINVTARLTDRSNNFQDIENANVSIFR